MQRLSYHGIGFTLALSCRRGTCCLYMAPYIGSWLGKKQYQNYNTEKHEHISLVIRNQQIIHFKVNATYVLKSNDLKIYEMLLNSLNN